MQEVLSKTPDSSQPTHGAQFIELRLSDIDPDEIYWVTETLYQWDVAKKQSMRDNPQIYRFPNFHEAQKVL